MNNSTEKTPLTEDEKQILREAPAGFWLKLAESEDRDRVQWLWGQVFGSEA
jgi:hypothetical protein